MQKHPATHRDGALIYGLDPSLGSGRPLLKAKRPRSFERRPFLMPLALIRD